MCAVLGGVTFGQSVAHVQHRHQVVDVAVDALSHAGVLDTKQTAGFLNSSIHQGNAPFVDHDWLIIKSIMGCTLNSPPWSGCLFSTLQTTEHHRQKVFKYCEYLKKYFVSRQTYQHCILSHSV